MVYKQNLSTNKVLRISKDEGSAGVIEASKMNLVEAVNFGYFLVISLKISKHAICV